MTYEQVLAAKIEYYGDTLAAHDFAAEEIERDRDRLLTLLRELYRDANPTILDDADTGVRLSPRWNERILKEIQDEKQTT